MASKLRTRVNEKVWDVSALHPPFRSMVETVYITERSTRADRAKRECWMKLLRHGESCA